MPNMKVRNRSASGLVEFLVRPFDSLLPTMPAWIVCNALRISTTWLIEDSAEINSSARLLRAQAPKALVNGLDVEHLLAIFETLDDQFPDCGIWPSNPSDRALARSITAQIMRVFAERLRSATAGEDAPKRNSLDNELPELEALVSERRDGGFLFGRFGAVDAALLLLLSERSARCTNLQVESYLTDLTSCRPLSEWLSSDPIRVRPRAYVVLAGRSSE